MCAFDKDLLGVTATTGTAKIFHQLHECARISLIGFGIGATRKQDRPESGGEQKQNAL
jgi:hypothetical protein